MTTSQTEWLGVTVENIPAELQAIPQWVVWRPERTTTDEATKVPYQSRRPSRRASSTDPATWSTFEESVRAYSRLGSTLAGIGLVLTEELGMIGTDLDNCLDPETGDESPEASAILLALNSYTERTPSGTGLRVFAYGSLPAGGRKKGDYEMYNTGRYLTVTGAHYGDSPRTIEHRPNALQVVHAKYIAKPKAPMAPSLRIVSASATNSTDDADILESARRAANGAKFCLLFDHGDTRGYPSHSEADLALCSILAYWTNGDAGRVDSLFRKSQLIRAKWDDVRGDGTYGANTIALAMTQLQPMPLRVESTASPPPHTDDEAPEDVLAPVVTVEHPSRARSLRDWLADPELLRPRNVVIPHLVYEGRVTLLSGREKVGKSTLLGGAIADASQGRSVFGVPLTRALHVLVYTIDEHVSDTLRRFARSKADLDHIIVNDAPRTVADYLAALDADLAAFPKTDVVMTDTLSKLLAQSGINPNEGKDVEPVIAKFADYFHQRNLAGVFSYHTNKNGREYKGSVAIGANVDDVLTLRRRGRGDEDDFDDDTDDDGRRLLVQDGRNIRGRLHLTCTDGEYRLFDDTAPPGAKIISVLRDHGAVTGRTALVKLAGIRKEIGLQVIGSLVQSGAIQERGKLLTLPGSDNGSRPVPSSGNSREPGTNGVIPIGSRFARGPLTEMGTGDDDDDDLPF